MKNIAILIFLLSGIVLFNACEKAETEPRIDFSQTVAPQMTEPADGSNFVLTEEEADKTITFSWSAAVYSFDMLAATSYELEIVQADSSFDASAKLTSTEATSITMTYAELNSVLIKLGLTTGESAQLALRVGSSLRSYDDGKVISSSVVNSDIAKISATPYTTEGPPDYPKLWVPGDYQGWSPADAPNVFSPDDDGVYNGYVYYPAESASFFFKFTDQPNWDGTNYGTGASAGTLDPTGDNLEMPGAGNYYMTADINSLTWTYNLENYALVGTFNAWGEQPDAPLTWDAANMVWTINIDLDAAAEFKWRANSAWDFNFGRKDPDDGKLVQGGANIVVSAAGNYTINLYLNEAFPRYELIAN